MIIITLKYSIVPSLLQAFTLILKTKKTKKYITKYSALIFILVEKSLIIRSDRISVHRRKPVSVCVLIYLQSLLISFNSCKLRCIQVIQVSSGKFR